MCEQWWGCCGVCDRGVVGGDEVGFWVALPPKTPMYSILIQEHRLADQVGHVWAILLRIV